MRGWQSIRKVVPDGGSFILIREGLERNRATVATLMLLIFFGLKSIMLLGILKSGANFNYMIEWFSVVAIFAGTGLTPIAARAIGVMSSIKVRSPFLTTVALIALPLQLAVLPINFPDRQYIAYRAKASSRIVERIASSTKPVISDDMALLIRAGREVRWEAAITAELGQLGKYDQMAFIRLIHAHCFSLFVTEGTDGQQPFTTRYNQPVAAAIFSSYPQEEKIDQFSLHWPSILSAPDKHCPL